MSPAWRQDAIGGMLGTSYYDTRKHIPRARSLFRLQRAILPSSYSSEGWSWTVIWPSRSEVVRMRFTAKTGWMNVNLVAATT